MKKSDVWKSSTSDSAETETSARSPALLPTQQTHRCRMQTVRPDKRTLAEQGDRLFEETTENDGLQLHLMLVLLLLATITTIITFQSINQNP